MSLLEILGLTLGENHTDMRIEGGEHTVDLTLYQEEKSTYKTNIKISSLFYLTGGQKLQNRNVTFYEIIYKL